MRDSVITLLFVVVVTVVYFLLPVPHQMRESSWAILFSGGSLALAVLIVVRIRKLLRETAGARARGLIVVVCCAVLFFAWANLTLARVPGEFADMQTKTDAVYFSVSTLTTVGFGDVHAASQLARAAVTMEMLFNLVFLGTAVTFVTGMIREHVQTTRRQAGAPDLHSGNGGSPGPGTGPAGGAR